MEQIDFKQAITDRLTELWNYKKYGSPFKEGDYFYYYKNNGLQNQYVLYQTADPDNEGEVFLDPNSFSDDGTVALANTSLFKGW